MDDEQSAIDNAIGPVRVASTGLSFGSLRTIDTAVQALENLRDAASQAIRELRRDQSKLQQRQDNWPFGEGRKGFGGVL